MKILLDENFPLQLYDRLRAAGYAAEHVIALGQRGLPDAAIRTRLRAEEELIFLTQDTDFEDPPPGCRATIIISRIPQSLRVRRRVELWMDALDVFLRDSPPGKLFELLETGEVVGWEVFGRE